MTVYDTLELSSWVALLTEGVDRNLVSGYQAAALENVALLTEGVDRNSIRQHLFGRTG